MPTRVERFRHYWDNELSGTLLWSAIIAPLVVLFFAPISYFASCLAWGFWQDFDWGVAFTALGAVFLLSVATNLQPLRR